MSILNNIETGNCILFVGAGFSRDATSSLNKPIMSGVDLQNYLLDESGISDKSTYDLESAAEEYIDAKSEDDLIKLLHSNFTSNEQTDDQTIISSQPWYRIYTTNYDNVIERACATARKQITTKTVSDPVEPPLLGTTQIIHIYGSAERLSPSEFKKHFLLTESQLDNSPFLSTPWFSRFSDDVLAAKEVVFVGFSLRDLDIRRLLRLLPDSTKDKIRFFEHNSVSKPTLNRLRKFGQVDLTGIQGLAKELVSARNGAPTNIDRHLPLTIKELEFDASLSRSISGGDISYLLIAGLLDDKKITQSDLEARRGSYTFTRNSASYTRAFSGAYKKRPILVHGDIGNGKSVFTHQLAYQFAQNGARVFLITREPENRDEILTFFSHVDGKCLIIFEDILSIRMLAKNISDIGNRNLQILATTRSSIFETSAHAISLRLGTGAFIEIDLNIPTMAEAKNIVQYLDENALFGDLAELDQPEREQFIYKDCGGQVRDVVLSLFQNGNLHDKVLDVLAHIHELDKSYQKIVVLGALLTLGGVRRFGQMSIVSELTNFNGSYEDFRQALAEKELKGLFQIDDMEISFRSAALAQFALKNIFSSEFILTVSKEALFSIDASFFDDPEFTSLSRALLKFSLYGKFMHSKTDEVEIEKFYDSCRVLKLALSDPLFLVQRSINSMHYRKFDSCHRYIETAYARARKRSNYDPYQIDTHYAKLMLSETLYEGIHIDLERETKSQELLESVMSRKSDDLYHPLSVMRLYIEIVRKWGHGMTSHQREILRKLVLRALARVRAFPKGARIRFGNINHIEHGLKEAAAKLL